MLRKSRPLLDGVDHRASGMRPGACSAMGIASALATNADAEENAQRPDLCRLHQIQVRALAALPPTVRRCSIMLAAQRFELSLQLVELGVGHLVELDQLIARALHAPNQLVELQANRARFAILA